jgi:hypothetical protein
MSIHGSIILGHSALDINQYLRLYGFFNGPINLTKPHFFPTFLRGLYQGIIR